MAFGSSGSKSGKNVDTIQRTVSKQPVFNYNCAETTVVLIKLIIHLI